MTDTKLTAITGGIGAGKSVVSRILRIMGYDVYDSDSRARAIMDSDVDIQQKLTRTFGPKIFDTEGCLNRTRLGEIVFNDKVMLTRLNEIVHVAVLADIARWRMMSNDKHIFVETAILYQSGMDCMVSDVWEVVASEDIRIKRIMARNNLSAEQARARIESQRFKPERLHPVVRFIDNSGAEALLPVIHALLRVNE